MNSIKRIFNFYNYNKKYLIISILFFFKLNISKAQETTLVLSNKCAKGISSFTKVNGIDRRLTKKTLGFVQTGIFNVNTPVNFKGNFIEGFCNFFQSKEVGPITDNEISIILYDLSLSEKAEEMWDVGSLKLTMRIFKKFEENKYEELYSIDSVYRMKSSTDLTKKLLKSVSEHLCEVAVELKKYDNLQTRNGASYTFEELQILDSVERMKIPIYITDNFKPGIYYDYNQFKNNSPDTTTIYIDSIHTDKIRVMVWSEEKGKNVELDSKTVYAVCDGNFLLKATKMGFYELKREGLDFCFFGQIAPKYLTKGNNVSPIIGPLIGGGVGVGVGVAVSLFMPSNQIPILNNYKINYRTGNPIQVDKDK